MIPAEKETGIRVTGEKERKAENRQRWLVFLTAGLCVLGAMAVLASFTGMWPWKKNSYNTYTLQALSWLQGRLDLGRNYTWLELAIYEGKYYVSFPPFPSVLMLPFAAVFGERTPDGWIALAVALAGVWHICALCREEGRSRNAAVAGTLFLMLCNGWLWITLNGYVWFFAQNCCFTLCCMSLYHAVRGRGCLSLGLWACAVGCRPMTAVFLPVLLWFLLRKEREAHPGTPWIRLLIRKAYWLAPAAVIGAGYMLLNALRFGNPLEFGHNYLPEFVRAEQGQFDLSYLGKNLMKLIRFPVFQDGNPDSYLLWYPIDGVGVYLVNPIFLIAPVAWIHGLRHRRKELRGLLVLLPLCTAAYVTIVCMHRTMGGWAFGNRYLLETMPFVFAGMLAEKPESERMIRICLPYALLCMMINLLGTVTTYNHWI